MTSILVVDDNLDNTEILARRLSRKGMDVMPCDSGHAALMILKEKRFDVIVLDLHMPDLSGLECIDAIKKDAQNSKVPIIVFTASIDDEQHAKAMEKGALAVLEKAGDISGLLEVIQKVAA